MDAEPTYELEGALARHNGRRRYESLLLTLPDGAVQRIRHGSAILVTSRRAPARRGRAHCAALSAGLRRRGCGVPRAVALTRRAAACVAVCVAAPNSDDDPKAPPYVAYVREVLEPAKAGGEPELSVLWRAPAAAARRAGRALLMRRTCGASSDARPAAGCTGRARACASRALR